MGRTCREELASGGTLIISENDFRIEYFFPGPDGRYGDYEIKEEEPIETTVNTNGL